MTVTTCFTVSINNGIAVYNFDFDLPSRFVSNIIDFPKIYIAIMSIIVTYMSTLCISKIYFKYFFTIRINTINECQVI